MVELAAGKNIYQSWNFMQRWSGANPKYFRYIASVFHTEPQQKPTISPPAAAYEAENAKKICRFFVCWAHFKMFRNRQRNHKKVAVLFKRRQKDARMFSRRPRCQSPCVCRSPAACRIPLDRLGKSLKPILEAMRTWGEGRNAQNSEKPEQIFDSVFEKNSARCCWSNFCVWLDGHEPYFSFCTYGTYFDDDKSNCFFFRSFFPFSCKFWSICLR